MCLPSLCLWHSHWTTRSSTLVTRAAADSFVPCFALLRYMLLKVQYVSVISKPFLNALKTWSRSSSHYLFETGIPSFPSFSAKLLEYVKVPLFIGHLLAIQDESHGLLEDFKLCPHVFGIPVEGW